MWKERNGIKTKMANHQIWKYRLWHQRGAGKPLRATGGRAAPLGKIEKNRPVNRAALHSGSRGEREGECKGKGCAWLATF